MSTNSPVHPLIACNRQINELNRCVTETEEHGFRELAFFEDRFRCFQIALKAWRNVPDAAKLLKKAEESLQQLAASIDALRGKITPQFFEGAMTRKRYAQIDIASTSVAKMQHIFAKRKGPMTIEDCQEAERCRQSALQKIAHQGPVPNNLAKEVNNMADDVQMYLD